ncbi:hypothetical protein SCHPADRAFT_937236 [Schizopora paradoxa]|uniref:SMC hinge domain-containing protein n=1 Tax=Schizopora paradoxa TaxID=27342 RepID=A0A0H2S003_9AGAM|nr:hypothetical protein SCHPADRAFT_937236 [Schizopora paradoxa]
MLTTNRPKSSPKQSSITTLWHRRTTNFPVPRKRTIMASFQDSLASPDESGILGPEQDTEIVSEAETPSKGRRGGSRAPVGRITSYGEGRAAAAAASTPGEDSVVESDAVSPPKRPRASAGVRQEAAAKEEEAIAESEDEFVSAAEDVEDEEDEQPVRPPRRGSRAPSKPPSSKSKAVPRGSRGKKTVDEETADEDVLPPPKSSSKGKARKATVKSNPPSRASVATLASEHEEPQDEGTPAPSDIAEDQPTPRAKRISTSEEPTQTMRTPVKPPKKAPVEEEDEVEEHSLLDPPDLPSPGRPRVSALPPPPMALVNFKSYAGRQIICPFHKSFSAIVGPNDAPRKAELIHNSANYPDLEECSVEVHFREVIDLPGADDYEMPNSQLVIARYAYKGNSSKYTINNKTSNFTEGEVESIAQMKPKAPSEHEDGLLEYLEDIIGTSKYKTPIDEALVELDALGEQRGEKLNRLRIVERVKNALGDKKHEVDDYLRLQNEYVRAQSRFYQWHLWQCFEFEEKVNEDIDEWEETLETGRESNKDDIKHHQELQTHYEERERAYKEVKQALKAATKELADQEKIQVNLVERKKASTAKAKKLRKTLKEDETKRDEVRRTIERSTEKIEKERRKFAEHEESLVEEERELEKIQLSLKDKTKVFHDQIEVKQKELQPWKLKIDAKQAEIDVAANECQKLQQKAEAVANSRKDAQADLDQLEAEFKTKDLRTKLETLRWKVQSSKQRVDEAKLSQAASTSQNKVLDGLTRLQSTGRISGFHGRLGALGTIPEKYDVAVSTACPSLNNLIVDTVDQGQACIEYLRKQNIGRASFTVLEKLSQTNGLDRIQTPENVPRLFDLIKPNDPKFAPAFFKAVGETLVAESLEQANRIAYAMSGGGTYVAKGAMSAKLAADVAQADLRRPESEAETLERKGPQIKTSLQKIDMELTTLRKRIDEATKRVKELKSKSKPDEGDLAPPEKKILEIGGSKLLAQKSKVDGIKTYINIATDEITTCEVNMATAEKDLKKLGDSIENKSSELVKDDEEVEKLGAELTTCENYVANLQDEVAKAQEVEESEGGNPDQLKQELDEQTEEIQKFRKKEETADEDVLPPPKLPLKGEARKATVKSDPPSRASVTLDIIDSGFHLTSTCSTPYCKRTTAATNTRLSATANGSLSMLFNLKLPQKLASACAREAGKTILTFSQNGGTRVAETYMSNSEPELELQRPGLRTRRGNASKHPGRVVTDLIQKRRSRSEAAAARKALAEAREKEAKEAEELIRQIEGLKLSLDCHRTAEMTARELTQPVKESLSADVSCPIDGLIEKGKPGKKAAPKPKGSKPSADPTQGKKKTRGEKAPADSEAVADSGPPHTEKRKRGRPPKQPKDGSQEPTTAITKKQKVSKTPDELDESPATGGTVTRAKRGNKATVAAKAAATKAAKAKAKAAAAAAALALAEAEAAAAAAAAAEESEEGGEVEGNMEMDVDGDGDGVGDGDGDGDGEEATARYNIDEDEDDAHKSGSEDDEKLETRDDDGEAVAQAGEGDDELDTAEPEGGESGEAMAIDVHDDDGESSDIEELSVRRTNGNDEDVHMDDNRLGDAGELERVHQRSVLASGDGEDGELTPLEDLAESSDDDVSMSELTKLLPKRKDHRKAQSAKVNEKASLSANNPDSDVELNGGSSDKRKTGNTKPPGATRKAKSKETPSEGRTTGTLDLTAPSTNQTNVGKAKAGVNASKLPDAPATPKPSKNAPTSGSKPIPSIKMTPVAISKSRTRATNAKRGLGAGESSSSTTSKVASSAPPKSAGTNVAAWRKSVLSGPEPSAASEVSSTVPSLSPSDSISQVDVRLNCSPLPMSIADAARGRDDTPRRLGFSHVNNAHIVRSSPLRARLSGVDQESHSRSRDDDEGLEPQPTRTFTVSHASAPASSTAVNRTASAKDNNKKNAFRKTNNMDVLTNDEQLDTLSSGRTGGSVSVSRGLDSVPCGVGRQATWKCKFVPTLIAHFCLSTDIWKVEPENMTDLLQSIWNAIYPGKKNIVERKTSDALFKQARQKIYDYRCNMSKCAMAAVRMHFGEEGVTAPADIISYAKHLADGCRFIVGEYKEVIGKTGEVELRPRKLYRTELCLRVLAEHFSWVEGAVSITGLPDITNARPVGAVVVCGTAIHQALRHFAAGKWNTKKADFSCGQTTVDTMTHTANMKNFLDENWPKLLDRVKEYESMTKKRNNTQTFEPTKLETVMDEPDSD